MKMNTFEWVVFVLVVVGALNWGLVALNFNLVEFLVGRWPMVARLVYALVGLSALAMVYSAFTKK